MTKWNRKKPNGLILCTGVAAALTISIAEAAPPKKPVIPELGRVDWHRGFDAAAQKARKDNKPLLVLFQEIPGCSTCVNYGRDVLSHPLIVDAAEGLFVPIVVYNNTKGDDERTLKSFQEPAWNNPVVRIITPGRRGLADRLAGDYSVAGLAACMVDALEKDGRIAPPYLRLLAEETAARKRGIEKATFAMHCFWEGEGALGELEGVIATRPGFVNKEEVVEVAYDPQKIDYLTLLDRARAMKCASRVYTRDERQQGKARKIVGELAVRTDEPMRVDKQPKYYLAQTPYRYIPMTELQASRINAAIGKKQDSSEFLSPSQLQLLRDIKAHAKAGWPNCIGSTDLTKAWNAAQRIAAGLSKPPRTARSTPPNPS